MLNDGDDLINFVIKVLMANPLPSDGKNGIGIFSVRILSGVEYADDALLPSEIANFSWSPE